MVRGLAPRSLVAWCAGGLLVWSCAAEPEPGAAEGRAGQSAGGSSGAGSSGNPAGGNAGFAGTAGSNGGYGGTAELDASVPNDADTAPEGGATGSEGGAGPGEAGASGMSEGGAAGSSNPPTPFDGRCGRGWASSGSALPPDLEGSVTPQVAVSGNWSFSFGRYRFVVEAKRGARIIEYSIDGNNLIDPTEGSTFWPSPQEVWSWPPPAELDNGAYTAEADATSLTLTSKASTKFKLSVRKRVWVNEASGVVSIEYRLTNTDVASASWAPWEVTRVPAGGFTFAPRGSGSRAIVQDKFQNPLPMALLPPAPAPNGIEWLDYPGLKLTLDNYLAEFDGAEGWLAHANRFGKGLLPVLFVKSFIDAPDESLPSNQAEIQLWTSGTAKPKLIEVEQQGALQVLAPGASLSWTVHWSACELPASLALAAGSAELASLARAHAIKP